MNYTLYELLNFNYAMSRTTLQYHREVYPGWDNYGWNIKVRSYLGTYGTPGFTLGIL